MFIKYSALFLFSGLYCLNSLNQINANGGRRFAQHSIESFKSEDDDYNEDVRRMPIVSFNERLQLIGRGLEALNQSSGDAICPFMNVMLKRGVLRVSWSATGANSNGNLINSIKARSIALAWINNNLPSESKKVESDVTLCAEFPSLQGKYENLFIIEIKHLSQAPALTGIQRFSYISIPVSARGVVLANCEFRGYKSMGQLNPFEVGDHPQANQLSASETTHKPTNTGTNDANSKK